LAGVIIQHFTDAYRTNDISVKSSCLKLQHLLELALIV